MKVVIYCRVSTEDQAENGTSLESQKQICEAQASAMGMQIVDVIEDAGVSGTKYDTRPGINKALELIEAGDADVLLTTKLDRIGRSSRVIYGIVERAVKAGAQVIADGMKFDQSTAGKYLLAVLSTTAEVEWDNIRERTMGGKQRKANQGIQPSRSKSPYGYHVVNNNDKIMSLYPDVGVGTYQIVEAEAVWVKSIYEQFDQHGNLSRTAKYLSSMGVPTPKGGRQWWARTICDILENPVYKGQAVYGRRRRMTEENRFGRQDPNKKVGASYHKYADESQ